ncbi:C-reactive protein-like [Heptranchias perlo]|uniref:C-reactive protein-like n=1 Tax=Heptranchias perlo TaxID=212740 RepID=UPI00355992C8
MVQEREEKPFLATPPGGNQDFADLSRVQRAMQNSCTMDLDWTETLDFWLNIRKEPTHQTGAAWLADRQQQGHWRGGSGGSRNAVILREGSGFVTHGAHCHSLPPAMRHLLLQESGTCVAKVARLTDWLNLCSFVSTGLLLKSLSFPRKTDDSYVIVQLEESVELRAFTLCMKVRSDSQPTTSVFSYATSDHHNQILLELSSDHLRLHLAEEQVEFKIPRVLVGWTPLCVTWDSESGRAAARVDGFRTAWKFLGQGKAIVPGGVLVLGQDQDKVGGGFSKEQSFVGEMTDLNLWDTVLRSSEIPTTSRRRQGNVINWVKIRYEIKGTVRIEAEDE